MPQVVFAPAIQRHIVSLPRRVAAATVAAALDAALEGNAVLRGYVLDEQGRLRKHVAIFVDGKQIRDRQRLSDVVSDNSEIYVVQALSGG